MSRLQLALNVSDLDQAIDFYSKYFAVEPHKIRPGYANFAVDEPPLKLVLIEGGGTPGSINHLGVEVFSSDEVLNAAHRFADVGFATDLEEQTSCCFAVQDKVWVSGPDGSRWETYTVIDDVEPADGVSGDGGCCVTDSRAPLSSSTNAACC